MGKKQRQEYFDYDTAMYYQRKEVKNRKIFVFTFFTLLAICVIGAGYLLASGINPFLFHMEPGSRQAFTQNNSKALDVTPLKGIHLTAPKGALDKDRTFNILPLQENEIMKLPANIRNCGLPLAAYDIDGNMTDTEIFPGKMTIDFDMRELGIPEIYWDKVGIASVDDNGNVTQFSTDLKQGHAICQSRHNNVFVLLGILAFTAYRANPIESRNEKWGGDNPQLVGLKYAKFDIKFDHEKIKAQEYSIYVPSGLKPQNPDEVKRVDDEIKKVWKDYGIEFINDDPYLNGRIVTYGNAEFNIRYEKISADARYKKLMDTMTYEWKKNNLWPAEAKVLADSLFYADDYLYEKVGLRAKSYKMDVVMLNPWPYGSAMGMAGNLDTGYPFMHVKQPGDSEKDEFIVTVAHELFHCIQEEYYYDGISKTFNTFKEMTAVALEKEINKYYKDNNIISNEVMTVDRDYYETLQSSFNDANPDNTIRNRHGYVLASFLEYLKEKGFFPNNGTHYVSALMESFSKQGVLPSQTLYLAAGKDEAVLSDAFSEYYRSQQSVIQTNLKAKFEANSVPANDTDKALLESAKKCFCSFTREVPFFSWKYEGEKPLAYEILSVSLDKIDKEALKDSILVLAESNSDEDRTRLNKRGIDILFNKDGAGWNSEIPNRAIAIKDIQKSIDLQRISKFATPPGLGGFETEVFIMTKPDQPKLEVSKDILRVTLPATPLFKNNYVRYYQMFVKLPESKDVLSINAIDGSAGYRMVKDKDGRITKLEPLDSNVEREIKRIPADEKAPLVRLEQLGVYFREVVTNEENGKTLSIAGPYSDAMIMGSDLENQKKWVLNGEPVVEKVMNMVDDEVVAFTVDSEAGTAAVNINHKGMYENKGKLVGTTKADFTFTPAPKQLAAGEKLGLTVKGEFSGKGSSYESSFSISSPEIPDQEMNSYLSSFVTVRDDARSNSMTRSATIPEGHEFNGGKLKLVYSLDVSGSYYRITYNYVYK